MIKHCIPVKPYTYMHTHQGGPGIICNVLVDGRQCSYRRKYGDILPTRSDKVVPHHVAELMGARK